MLLFAALLLLWILMSGSLELAEWVAGSMAAMIVVVLTGNSRVGGDHESGSLILSTSALLALLRYTVLFIRALVRANLDMARRVLSPSLPLDPVLVEVETELRSSIGKLMLANSITLTPGTLTVELEQNRLLIHWVDGSALGIDMGSDERLQQATREIAASFEQQLKGFLR